MLYVVIAFLWVSICLYLLLGGADFGAGIVELATRRRNQLKVQKIMNQTIGPIWEANHMWLIIAVVILFVGFPTIYTTLSIYLHIPLVIMLLGIIARGTAFVFRHYDAVTDNWQQLYTQIFRWSSVVTPFFLGMIAAASISGTIDPTATAFVPAYIDSWLTWFGVAVGIFTVCICGYLAASYGVGMVSAPYDRILIARTAKRFLYGVVLSGGLVFVAAYYSGIPLLNWIFGDTLGQVAMILTTLSLGLTFYALQKPWPVVARLAAGFQIALILLAATYQHYPVLVLFKEGEGLSLTEYAHNNYTIAMLAWALLLGSIFILPFLFYLMRVFSKKI